MKLLSAVSVISLVCVLAASSAMAAEPAAACAVSDAAKVKEHFTKHVTYPVTGAAMKEVCRKEMPNEFTEAERKCLNGKIMDKKTYKSADEVLATLNVK